MQHALVLRALHHQWCVGERGILPAVVEVEMRVDDHRHVDGRETVIGERVGDGAVHHLEVPEHLVWSTAPRVDEHHAELVVEDDVAVHRPLLLRDEKVPEVEALDLHQSAVRPQSRIRLNG